MAKTQKKLGEILVEWGIISAKEVTKALDHAKAKNLRIGEALVDLKLCSESNVYKALAAQHNMEYVEVDRASIPANAGSLVPEDLMRKYLILPLGMENGKLRLAVGADTWTSTGPPHPAREAEAWGSGVLRTCGRSPWALGRRRGRGEGLALTPHGGRRGRLHVYLRSAAIGPPLPSTGRGPG